MPQNVSSTLSIPFPVPVFQTVCSQDMLQLCNNRDSDNRRSWDDKITVWGILDEILEGRQIQWVVLYAIPPCQLLQR